MSSPRKAAPALRPESSQRAVRESNESWRFLTDPADRPGTPRRPTLPATPSRPVGSVLVLCGLGSASGSFVVPTDSSDHRRGGPRRTSEKSAAPRPDARERCIVDASLVSQHRRSVVRGAPIEASHETEALAEACRHHKDSSAPMLHNHAVEKDVVVPQSQEEMTERLDDTAAKTRVRFKDEIKKRAPATEPLPLLSLLPIAADLQPKRQGSAAFTPSSPLTTCRGAPSSRLSPASLSGQVNSSTSSLTGLLSPRDAAQRRRRSRKEAATGFEGSIGELHEGLARAIASMKAEFGFEDPAEIAAIDGVLDVLAAAHLGARYAIAHPLREVREDTEGHPPPPPVVSSASVTATTQGPDDAPRHHHRHRPFISSVARQQSPTWSVLDEPAPRRIKPPLNTGLQCPRPPDETDSGFAPSNAADEGDASITATIESPSPDQLRQRSASTGRRSSFAAYSKQFRAQPLSSLSGRECDEGVEAALPSLTKSITQLAALGLM